MATAGGDLESVSSPVPNPKPVPAPASPRNRVKFLCSHDGKILPRPSDGRLKYVGGVTRVISVPRDITFIELMKKLTDMFKLNGETVLKYQVIPEDLDVLISVKSDDDVVCMIEEIDHLDLLSLPRLRSFLFSLNPIVIRNQIQSMDHNISLEQRYINYINGYVMHPSPTYNAFRPPPPVYTTYTTVTISSASSSTFSPPETSATATISSTRIPPETTAIVTIPSSSSSSRTPPESTTTAAATSSDTNSEVPVFHGRVGGRLPRTQSSPSFFTNSLSNHRNPVNHHHHHPPPPPQLHHQTSRPPLDRHPHAVVDYYRQHMNYTTANNRGRNREGHNGVKKGGSI